MTADEVATLRAENEALREDAGPIIEVDHAARKVLIRDGRCLYGVNYQPAGTVGYQVTFRNCKFDAAYVNQVETLIVERDALKRRLQVIATAISVAIDTAEGEDALAVPGLEIAARIVRESA